MTQQATAKIANVKGSIQQYIATQLAATFALPTGDIDYGGGVDFADSVLTWWLQVRLLEPARSEDGVGPRAPKSATDSDHPYGREMYHLLNLNIFVRPRKLSPRNNVKLETLRDTVVDKFVPVSTRIEVKNYSGDSASLGYLVVEALDADRPVSDVTEPELLQWNLVIALRWTEMWT